MVQKVKKFLTTDIWRIRLKSTSRGKYFFIKYLRIILLGLRGFGEDKCKLQASALTFFSLLSVVPVVAMAFGIAKGFGFEKVLEKQLMENFEGQQEVIARVIEFAQTMLENTRGGLIAGIGVALLFWTVIKVLSNIENSFNDIWGIKTSRTLMRKFGDYLAIMLICPVLLMVSSSMTVFITSQITLITEKIALLGAISGVIFFMLKALPYCVLWLLFSFIYIVMPNTKVNVSSGFFGAVIAGSIYQIVQWLYITFQIGASKYGAIYGSFAALPLFLIWLQMSWLIVLLGAELSFAHQNVETYEFEPDCLAVSHTFKRLLALRIVNLVVKNFTAGKTPLNTQHLSQTLEIPIRLLNQTLYELVRADILVEVAYENTKLKSYQPSRDSGALTIQYVLNALDHAGTDSLPVEPSPELKQLTTSLKMFNEAIKQSPSNILVNDI